MTRMESDMYFATFTRAFDAHNDAAIASHEAQVAVIELHRFSRTSRMWYRVAKWIGLI